MFAACNIGIIDRHLRQPHKDLSPLNLNLESRRIKQEFIAKPPVIRCAVEMNSASLERIQTTGQGSQEPS